MFILLGIGGLGPGYIVLKKRLTGKKSLVKMIILNKIESAWFQEYQVKDIISPRVTIISRGVTFSAFSLGGRES